MGLLKQAYHALAMGTVAAHNAVGVVLQDGRRMRSFRPGVTFFFLLFESAYNTHTLPPLGYVQPHVTSLSPRAFAPGRGQPHIIWE